MYCEVNFFPGARGRLYMRNVALNAGWLGQGVAILDVQWWGHVLR